jgi:hypothetical protein
VVERRTLSDSGNALEAIVTVKDPGAFKAPWSGSARYSPACLLVGEKIIELAVTGERNADRLPRALAEFGIENDGSLWRH